MFCQCDSFTTNLSSKPLDSEWPSLNIKKRACFSPVAHSLTHASVLEAEAFGGPTEPVETTPLEVYDVTPRCLAMEHSETTGFGARTYQ
jgi:hypothetical protein